VGAVYSQLHRPWLDRLAAEKRLAHDDHPAGFIPGEAAVCLVLERFEHARARGAPPLAIVRHVEIDHEPIPIGPEHPIRAEALSRAVQRCLGDDAAAIRRVVADLDGERWRALEWSLVETRCFAALRKGWQLWHPADSIGDVGAAAGAVGIGVAARAFARGYADGGSVLVTCASIGGTRAAARIDPIRS
jgi:3-oxoacyl-[acyl-carrier-protein] synthase-1